MSIEKDLYLNIFWALTALFFCFKYFSLQKRFINEKNYFINTLSHDIRVTILAQLLGLNLLKKCFDKNSVQSLIEDISNSTEYNLEMINMLINTYKFENGDSIISSKEFNLSNIVFSACDSLSEIAAEKKISIHHNLGNFSLYGGISELNKAIKILIFTAIQQANKESKITCNLKYKNGKILFEINYHGKPLTYEEQQRILSRDSRFSTVGHGIKMHFCKKIIDFHGGKIKILNKNNNNSFIVILPDRTPKKSSKVAMTAFLNA